MNLQQMTTTIILDKGTEDVYLLKEIQTLISKGALGEGRDIYKE